MKLSLEIHTSRGTGPVRKDQPTATVVTSNAPIIELVYGPLSLQAVMVRGRLDFNDTMMLLKLLPRAKHSKHQAKAWGLDVLFYDPDWAVPAHRPTGQRIAFLPRA